MSTEFFDREEQKGETLIKVKPTIMIDDDFEPEAVKINYDELDEIRIGNYNEYDEEENQKYNSGVVPNTQ